MTGADQELPPIHSVNPGIDGDQVYITSLRRRHGIEDDEQGADVVNKLRNLWDGSSDITDRHEVLEVFYGDRIGTKEAMELGGMALWLETGGEFDRFLNVARHSYGFLQEDRAQLSGLGKEPTEDTIHVASFFETEENPVVAVTGELPSGVTLNLYVDYEVLMLARQLPPSQPRDRYRSRYGDGAIEETVAFPLVALGMATGRYYGLDDEGLQEVVRYASGLNAGFTFDVKVLPDVRTVDIGDKSVYFPTAQLIEAFQPTST